MSYLANDDIMKIQEGVRLLSIDEVDDISHYFFDSGIPEYNDFLDLAGDFSKLNISKTFLLVHKETDDLIAYMTLSADSIKLTGVEKDNHGIAHVPYASIPALKVGKLAVNQNISQEIKRKGYGSFMLEMARNCAFMLNEAGVACRFITVDADVEYFSDTPLFYLKNGFVENLSNKRRKKGNTVSMRKDIFTTE